MEEEKKEEEPKMGALQMLNALKGSAAGNSSVSKELMYLDVVVNGRATKAMVDTGATHNFVSQEEAFRDREGMPFTAIVQEIEKERPSIREKGEPHEAVNSEAKPILGVAKGVEIQIESWKGDTNFSVAPLDDFQMRKGIEFLSAAKVVPMPHLRAVGILDEKTPCMVSTTSNGKAKMPMISALQLKKGLKKGEDTFLVALKDEGSELAQDVPPVLEDVLREFADVMPAELPKRLPPRREVDHQIELEPGSPRDPAMVPL